MAFGKRIRFFRLRKGLKQKELGEMLGFMGKTSDVRLAQYENEARTPKNDLINRMADIFDVDARAITVPEIDSYVGLMHTLFALEDMYGLKIGETDDGICLKLDRSHKEYHHLIAAFSSWQQQKAKLDAGEISQDEYDTWRYKYPAMDNSQIRVKVPSAGLMDLLTEELKK